MSVILLHCLTPGFDKIFMGTKTKYENHFVNVNELFKLKYTHFSFISKLHSFRLTSIPVFDLMMCMQFTY